jgi:hypothetical protein
MSTRLKIKVTKDILKKSMYCGLTPDLSNSTENCAIALAIRNVFPKATVGRFEIKYNDKALSISELPIEAELFISRFDKFYKMPDQRLEMDEIEFEIDVPDEVIDAIGIEDVKRLLISHPTLEMVEN